MSALPDRDATALRRQLPNAAALVAALIAVVLARSFFVALYATELPFWDQWDADIRTLYKPLVDGNLGFLDLFAAHNEHRIFFTRALGLLLFGANEGQFDNVVVAFANTVVYAAMLGAFAAPYFRALDRRSLLSAGLALVAIGGLPYAWENITIGFQNQFYFSALWTLIAIRGLAFGRGWRAVAASCGAASCGLLAMATGVLAAPALAVVAVCRYRNSEFSGRQLAVAVAAAGVIFAVGLALVPTTAHHGSLRSQDVAELVSTAMLALAWPLTADWRWLALPLIWWPSVLWAWRNLQRSRATMPALDVFLFGIATWTALVAVAVAAARGHDMTEVASRYTETLVLGYTANLLLAIRVVQALPDARRRLVAAASVSVVVSTSVLVVGLYGRAIKGTAYLAARAGQQGVAEVNIVAFVNGAGATALLGKPPQDVSHPSAQRVVALLSDPVVRRMLPPSARVPARIEWPDCAALSSPGAYPTTPALAVPAFGTYSPTTDNRNVGRCVSAPVYATRSHVRVATAGYLDRPGMNLSLRAATGEAEVSLKRAEQDGERWQTQEAAVPAPVYVIVVEDGNPEFWFAFGAPVEEGRLSALAADFAWSLRELGMPR
jgi:hypothetical protein